ncbi:MAG: metallophosphoesterase family protein, partial [Candidatus Dormibacteraceae bacterium]
MRVAVLSDPHGDHVALAKVIAHLEHAGPVDEVLIGGDLAQGGGQPSEVVDEIRRRGWRSVRGNADDLLVRIAGGSSADDALRPAREAHKDLLDSVASHAARSVKQLGPGRIDYLRSLPISIELG